MIKTPITHDESIEDDFGYNKNETIEDVTERIHELKERTREKVIEFRDILKSIEKGFYPGETMKKFDDLILAFYEIYEEQDSLIEDLSKFFIV